MLLRHREQTTGTEEEAKVSQTFYVNVRKESCTHAE